jgi:CheY-like chemotaxis protein
MIDVDNSPERNLQADQNVGVALLVDDEELVRVSTAAMLSDLGYDVVEAGSASEALELLAKGTQPTLLVTDHLMPRMNGAELVSAIKEVRPDLPMLIVSGYAEVEGIDPSVPRLTKPFRRDELAAQLRSMIEKAGSLDPTVR